MKKSALTTIVGILLILYAFTNIGASMGQFAKGKAVSGTTSFAASMGNLAGDHHRARDIRNTGNAQSVVIFAIAIFILVTAVLELASAVGLFSGASWVLPMLMATAVCGILVEGQDVIEDGFGTGKLIFFSINAIALLVALTAEKQRPVLE